jgi:hypothetical protein
MSEYENAFITQLREDFNSFKEDIDKKYSRMQNFLLTICGLLLSAGLVVGFTHFTRDGETRSELALVRERQNVVLENAVTQKAINDIIVTFDNQTKIMEQFLPKDIEGAVKEFNRVSSNFRSYIMAYQSGIVVRSANAETETGKGLDQ